MGVELVRDRATLEPAAAETSAICERMRELGVIVQPTGDRMNVLKMKPPDVPVDRGGRLLRRHARPGADHRVVRPAMAGAPQGQAARVSIDHR